MTNCDIKDFSERKNTQKKKKNFKKKEKFNVFYDKSYTTAEMPSFLTMGSLLPIFSFRFQM